MQSLSTILAELDRRFPPSLAAEWDNVGLLLGDPTISIKTIMTCLTITPEVVAEAIDRNVGLIITHHPVMFRPTKKLIANSGEGKLLWPLISKNIAVYSPHTAFDNAQAGINQWIADQLQLQAIEPLRRGKTAKQLKIVVFVPERDLEAVQSAMFQAGAGHIGNYQECSFRIEGTGTFFGNDLTNPTIGQRGQGESVQEHRLEVICPEKSLTAVIKAMIKAHSYEEPAFDIYPLESVPSSSGEGRLGEFAQSTSLQDLAKQVLEKLQSGPVSFVGSASKSIQRVAIACGAAGEFLDDALRANADVFITGEMRFHDLLKAEARGIGLILPGHYATERPAVEMLADQLRDVFTGVEVFVSQQEHDPQQWV
jgi:dinuclear metal center YbgI/SA1388 family protein